MWKMQTNQERGKSAFWEVSPIMNIYINSVVLHTYNIKRSTLGVRWGNLSKCSSSEGLVRLHFAHWTKPCSLGLDLGSSSMYCYLTLLVEMFFWPKGDIETFPSKQKYLYLSLVDRKVAEFQHNIDRRRYLVWLKWLIFITFFRQLLVSLLEHLRC